MELKLQQNGYYHACNHQQSSNRTFMELKSFHKTTKSLHLRGSNRTFMELKLRLL